MSANTIIHCTRTQWTNMSPEPGQVVIIRDSAEERGEVKMWTGTEWAPLTTDVNSEITMTAYDMNKQLIHQLPDLDHDTILQKKEMIYDFCRETQNSYYMLLCRDTNYYTLLHRIGGDPTVDFISDVVTECAETQGAIKSIELTEDKNAIEIWVDNPNFEDSTYVMYFFPYDGGVEPCR